MNTTNNSEGRSRKTVVLLLGGAAAIVAGIIGLLTVLGGSDPADEAAAVTDVLAASQDLDAGTPGQALVQEDLYQVVAMPAEGVSGTPITDPSQFSGQELSGPVSAGQVLVAENFRPVTAESLAYTPPVPIPEGHEAVAVTQLLDPAVAGTIQPNDRIAIYAILNGGLTAAEITEEGETEAGTVGEPVVQTLLRDVLVLGTSNVPIAGTSPASISQSAQRVDPTIGSVTFVLALTPQQAAEVIYAQTNHSLYFALLGDEPPTDVVSVDGVQLPDETVPPTDTEDETGEAVEGEEPTP